MKKYANKFNVTLHESALSEPLKCKEPSMIFVCSMADIFHDKVPDYFIDKIFEVIKVTPIHNYQILTKRPGRMAEYFKNRQIPKNARLSVTVEASSELYRIDDLRNLSSTVRFFSAEPLLADLGEVNLTNINWMLVAGESGVKGRPMQEAWVLSLYKQCQKNNVGFFLNNGVCGDPMASGVRKKRMVIYY